MHPDRGCCRADHSCECSSIMSGLLRPCLLLLIAEGNMKHGYELVAGLETLGLDVNVEGGRLYRVLRHLEGEGFVASAWDTQTSGPARREYFITVPGREALKGAVADLRGAVSALTSLADRIGRLPEDNTRDPGLDPECPEED
jgi:DNA-binding PadR family transcriptional regulator